MSPGGAVILEGSSALRRELDPFYDFKVWVISPRRLRLQRGITRDGEAARSQWVDHWMPAEERYFRLHRPQNRSDLWVDGTGRPGIDPQTGFVSLDRR